MTLYNFLLMGCLTIKVTISKTVFGSLLIPKKCLKPTSLVLARVFCLVRVAHTKTLTRMSNRLAADIARDSY